MENMNRKIAFRAWDVENKVMINAIFVGLGKVYGMTKTFKPSKKLENVILMQCTGLQDRTGRDIFEGDIVNYGDNFPSLVIWDEFAVRETPGFWLEERADYGYLRFHTMTAYTNPIEIFGNIYENPELLDNKYII